MCYPGLHRQNVGAEDSQPPGCTQLPNLGQHGNPSSLPEYAREVPESAGYSERAHVCEGSLAQTYAGKWILNMCSQILDFFFSAFERRWHPFKMKTCVS